MQKSLHTILLTLISLMMLNAQSGRISGKITDDLGLVMPGAAIWINTNPVKGTISDNAGKYQITGLDEGEFTMTITYLGYEDKIVNVSIINGKSTELNVSITEASLIGDEVLILGDRLRGQAKALNQQKNNANITNIVAADQIGKFPDANIGDAVKRIPGITMQNDQGEARNIIIRGMAPQLNSVTINGERVPSAEGDNRNVQMDLIPADMVQAVEVNKAVLPNMDADAIGGSVNLVTRKAPSGLRLSGTLGSGLNLLSEKPIWNGSLILGDRLMNDKLGVILSASYNNHTFGSDNFEGAWAETDVPGYPVVLSGFDLRKYDVQRVRRSASLSLDYEVAKGHNIYFNSMYNWRDDWENRYRFRVDRLNTPITTNKFTKLSDGLLELQGRVAIQTKGGIDNDRNKGSRLEDQRVANYTLSGDHALGKMKMTWSGTYATAQEDRPNERYITHRSNKTVIVDYKDPSKYLVTLKNSADELTLSLNEIYESNNNTNEKDINGRLDFELPIFSNNGKIQFGARYRGKDKERVNTYDIYDPITDLGSGGNTMANLPVSRQNERIFLNGEKYVPGNFVTKEFLGGLDLGNASKFEKEDAIAEYITTNYTAQENIAGGYVMADYKITDKLLAIVGVRIENTSIKYSGFEFDEDNEEAKPTAETTKKYTNILPGAHLKYDFNDNSILRFAWTNTLARPNYFDLVPYANYSPDNMTLVEGNSELKSTTAMNFDLMYENYFKSIGVISVGGFYKDISNFIYSKTDLDTMVAKFGQLRSFTRPENGGTADVYGFEVAVQRQLDFLPGFLKGFGVYLNYTFTESSTTGIQERENDDLRLTGTAKNMFNASLSYETKKLVVRTSLNFASDYIDLIGGTAFNDIYYDKQTFVDVNASYAITPKWRIYAEANNLTNQPLRYYQGIQERTFQEEFYNARINLGVKFDFFGK
ncbi:MAG: TonB-dependent receptor [Saprospiraceae bacterium]|jgi:TonB-dependent receptor|nr:TonB-dependent receptor [Saprospiraceae bacterium]MBP6568795.1 TonB-dependent receptor [Saprospiraceae bacterium]